MQFSDSISAGYDNLAAKVWYFKYRFGGKEKKLPIGAFPEVSLSQARQLRDRARLKVSDGIDPMLERKRKKASIKLGAENTFEVIANKYIDEKMVPEGRAEPGPASVELAVIPNVAWRCATACR